MAARRRFLVILALGGLLAGCVGSGYADSDDEDGYFNGGHVRSPYPHGVIQPRNDWGRRAYVAPQPYPYYQPQGFYGWGRPQGCRDGARFGCSNKDDGQNGK
ncbi:MAG: hypothetical protein ACOVVK_20610 [Elsteraceae bacterium]